MEIMLKLWEMSFLISFEIRAMYRHSGQLFMTFLESNWGSIFVKMEEACTFIDKWISV